MRSWVARDNCDNLAMASQTITVEDTTAPEIVAPADIVVESRLLATNLTVTNNDIRVCAAVIPGGSPNESGDYVLVESEVYNALSDLMQVGDVIRIGNAQRTITSVQNANGPGYSLKRLRWNSNLQNVITSASSKIDLVDNLSLIHI